MEQEEISAAQIRAARALLGITQAGLADIAALSSMTVKRAEGSGSPFPSPEAIVAIRNALETAGIDFIPENGGGVGVRLKNRNKNV